MSSLSHTSISWGLQVLRHHPQDLLQAKDTKEEKGSTAVCTLIRVAMAGLGKVGNMVPKIIRLSKVMIAFYASEMTRIAQDRS